MVGVLVEDRIKFDVVKYLPVGNVIYPLPF
jgi:hypothetical protein